MLWRVLIIRFLIFAVPGVLLLAGGPSPPRKTAPAEWHLSDLLAHRLFLENWPGLIISAVLICLPGMLLFVGADFLAEISFVRVPLKKTPSSFWTVMAYLVVFACSFLALARLTGH